MKLATERNAENIQKSKSTFFYPFYVSERDEEGRAQFVQKQYILHDFAIVTDVSVRKEIFDWYGKDLPTGAKIYEVRVKNSGGEWQDWQAIVGNIRIVSFADWQPGQDADSLFDASGKRFQEHFQIRHCGTLFCAAPGYVQVINEDDEIIRTINPRTLRIEYDSQVSNLCYPLDEQLGDMVKFRKLYYDYDEKDPRCQETAKTQPEGCAELTS